MQSSAVQTISHYPSVWEQAIAWANRETAEETIVVTTTFLLVGSLFFSFFQSLL
jgi:hypothetical protein